ncbi:T-cell surface protein tactile-like [Sceloporus undulatus]|uniref:T-cell surface protein tactile-like n=1 Tax=Sceloporus undulatus TaxID=8520 RepID=UPI001C4BC9B5|nr:T-cell surface protein tactile-like [Sceloporus undulatus]
MEMRWLLWAYYFILTHIISALSEIIIKNEKTVYALPGDDVTLTCSILKGKGIHVTQTQWSKVDELSQRTIGVYNPRYGTTFNGRGYNYSMNFRKAFQFCQPDFSHSTSANYAECDQWILQMRNVSLELSGLYQCSFTTFPAGTSSSEINLVIIKSDDKNFVAETLLNQTLEIPCLKDVPSENLTNSTLKWFLKENKNEELLISKQSYYAPGYKASPTIFKDRIKINPEDTLIISPVSVLDDGKKFVCSVFYQPGRIIKSTTDVKVFVKPEISITLNTSLRRKANFTCVVRKAFPKPNLLWYMDGKILKDKSEGISIQNQVTKLVGGFYEMQSLLTIWSSTQLPINQAYKCMTVYLYPGNETLNISSEEVILSYGLQTTTSESFIPSRKIPLTSDSSTGQPWHSTKDLQDKTLAKFFSFSTVLQRNLSTERVAEQTTVGNHDNSPTLKGQFNETGTAAGSEHIHFSWPAVVAALIFFCTCLIILGIRKWCQYQKEIMNRPPSFKPPPPPIKYTSMPVCAGIYTACNELENL